MTNTLHNAFALIFDHMCDIIMVTVPDGTIVYTNEAAQKFHGYSREELLLMNIGQIDGQLAVSKLTFEIDKTFESGVEFNTNNRRKDGSLVPVKVRTVGMQDKKDGNKYFVSIIQDIQDLIEIEKEEKLLREKQKRSAMALDGGNFGIWDFDYSTKELYMTNGLSELLGYEQNNMLDPKSWMKVMHADDLKKVGSFRRGIADNKPFAAEFRIRHNKSMEYWWILLKGKVFDRFEDGSPRRLVGTYEDIMSQKKNEIELERKNNELSILAEEAMKANQAKSQFLANVSHEIRTPLNGIIMASQLIEREENAEKRKNLIGIIQNSSEILKGIVTDVLDLSKAEQNGVHLVKESFDLSGMVLELFRELQISANQKNLEAACFIDPQIKGEYIGDVQKIKQILRNLLSNALKFTDAGMIGIRTKVIQNLEEESDIEFSVKDTGIGIGDEFSERIFESFAQGNESVDKQYQGTGLGLAICRKFSEAMGGSVYYEKNKREGTTFVFSCRLKKDKSTGIKPTFTVRGSLPEFKLRKKVNILSVDDNMVNQELIKRVLEQNDMQCTLVYVPEEALVVLENGSFDLILMDIQMPKMSGYRLTELIRQNEQFGKLPIIAMTAYARMEDKEKCMQAGMNEYITKPIRIEQLLHKITSILDKNIN